MTKLLHCLVGACLIATGAFLTSVRAESSTSKPAATQPALPSCCGDECKNMGASCCTAGDKGKVTCSMGGSCCKKADDKGTGGMDIGK